MINISDIEQYQFYTHKGFEPLIDWRNFHIEISLRKKLQEHIFGKGNSQRNNEKFYKWVWEHKPHYCEETMKRLEYFSAVFISHILSRGAFPEMAYDPRNTNILSFEAHNKWENGDRNSMRIYEENQIVIDILKKDYNYS